MLVPGVAGQRAADQQVPGPAGRLAAVAGQGGGRPVEDPRPLGAVPAAAPLPRLVRAWTARASARLRQDLDRFTFLLGGDDGESLFGPGTAG